MSTPEMIFFFFFFGGGGGDRIKIRKQKTTISYFFRIIHHHHHHHQPTAPQSATTFRIMKYWKGLLVAYGLARVQHSTLFIRLAALGLGLGLVRRDIGMTLNVW